jgi:hypothetical protein
MRAIAALVAVVILVAPGRAAAQESRAEVLSAERAAKATRLAPYEPSRLETLVMQAEAGRLRRLIAPHNGFFVEYGYTRKPVGSGIAFGGGFRHDLFDRTARIELEAGASFRAYQLLRADFSLPRLAGERLELGIEATYRRHPQEDFYGGGPGSLKADRVSFFYQGRDVQGRVVAMPRPWLRAGTRFGYLSPSIGPGTDSRFPTIGARFDDAAAPGLAAQPAFAYGDLFAEVDYRDEPGNARDGGHYSARWRRYSDRERDGYTFDSAELLLQQFVPVFDKKRVFAFQTGFAASTPADGHRVPFYLQPTLGGSHTLRSVADYRFRDTHAFWLNAEYRWEAFGLLDMALFTDWGTVAPRAADLDLSDLRHAYGIGLRFNTSRAVLLRIDIATGAGEGVRYFLKFNRAF